MSRVNHPVGFYADEARTVALMHLNPQRRFNPWVPLELTDTGSDRIGAVQKVFVRRRRRSHYLLYGRDGAEVARVEAQLPAALARRRAGGVAVAAAAGALAIPVVGVAGVAAVASLAVSAAVRQVLECVDPIDSAPELRILRGDQTLGVVSRWPLAEARGPGTSTVPLPWGSPTRVYEIDLGADPARTLDRRLALAVPVALDALRGVFVEVPLR